MGPVGALAMTRHLVKKLPYDIERDFQPIALVTRGQMLLAVSPNFRSAPCRSWSLWRRPNRAPWSTRRPVPARRATSAELFNSMAGTDIAHVPYRGGSTAITDLMSGQVHMMLESLSSIAPFAQSGMCARWPSRGRADRLPFQTCRPSTRRACRASRSRPGTALSGLPACRVRGRQAQRRDQSCHAHAGVRRPPGALGQEVAGGTPENSAQTIQRRSAKWLDVIRRSGLKPD